jgi:hypothetical protein
VYIQNKKIELTVENLGYQLLKRADGVGYTRNYGSEQQPNPTAIHPRQHQEAAAIT